MRSYPIKSKVPQEVATKNLDKLVANLKERGKITGFTQDFIDSLGAPDRVTDNGSLYIELFKHGENTIVTKEGGNSASVIYLTDQPDPLSLIKKESGKSGMELAELAASFGYDVDMYNLLVYADDDDKNVRIWTKFACECCEHTEDPTIAMDTYLTDESGKVMVFVDKEDAENYIDSRFSEDDLQSSGLCFIVVKGR